MSVGIGRQNIIILLRKEECCTVSFLGIHNWEPDIYIGFSSALYLQCRISEADIIPCVKIRSSRDVLYSDF
jgi:hypothetical protein